MSETQTALASNIAFIFPGQGSQALGMLNEFSETKEVIETFQRASEVLGYDLWALCQQGPEEQLNRTDKTQPALLAASYALWQAWKQRSSLPTLLAGHSLGEYSALVCAGIMNFEDAINLVEKRGKFMQQAVPAGVGKMAAIIGLDDEKVKASCESAAGEQIVSPVNYNSPGQVVIAGNADAVERAIVSCKENGAKKAMPLAVSVPSHCLLMKPASEQLSIELSNINFNSSEIKVVNNVDVAIETDQARIKDALVRQLYCPVRWAECVNFIAAQGVDRLVEVGPGKVLSGLNRRIDRSLTSNQINKLDSLNQLVSELS
ncbi:MAG: ACP S-malonyltransferase [Kangiellaceae bacterium]|nr:ACP S-malonyltransferase [Kangiellaceae bacterium]